MTKNNMTKVAQAISAAQEGKVIYQVSLGVVPEKELKRELKALKVRAKDLVVKTMMRAKAFAKWGGSIECCDSTLVSILLVNRRLGDQNLKKMIHILDNIVWPKFIEV